MHYREHQPAPALARHIECIWFVSDAQACAQNSSEERVLPDGCVEWIFHLGTPFRRLVDAGWEVQPCSFVVGALTRFILLEPAGPIATMGVRFRPGGAYPFLPFPLDLLTDNSVPTIDIWAREGRLLEEAVLSAANDLERQTLIERFLHRRLLNSSNRRQFEAAVSTIVQTRGQTRVTELAAAVGWSARQLEREFRIRAGISPKALARIIRFQRLLQLVGEAPLREWATLALEGGYSDQPHMVREFREFSGQSPNENRIALTSSLVRNLVSPRRLAALLGTP